LQHVNKKGCIQLSGARVLTGIPIPDRKTSGKRKYKWEKLEIDECFEIKTKSSGVSLAEAANKAHAPKKFESHVVEGTTYVWRIK
jgi:hypothetical protein